MTLTVNTSGASRPSGEPRGGAENAGVARPYPVRYVENPSQSELRKLALAHTPAVIQTRQGSVVKVSRNKNRMAQYTYVVAAGDEAKQFNLKPIDPTKARELIA